VHLAVAGSEAALATLRDGLADLRDQLGSAGLDLGDVTMTADADAGRGDRQDRAATQPAGTGTTPWSGSDGRERPGGRASGAPASPGTTPAPGTPDPMPTPATPRSTGGGLDVRV
jgi:hypothetical protein